jgi:hypothetical protein
MAGALQRPRPVLVTYHTTRDIAGTVTLANDQTHVVLAMRSWLFLDGLGRRDVQ